ncbi:MAG: MarR family transcriptional regulator [Anaerolineaceae bacterium]|nr:MarR family transcriptional regulator [Anaerolineaceae bacterium]
MVNEKFEHFGFLLSRVGLAHRNMVGQKMRVLGLHRGQPPVLFTLEKHEGMSNSEMAEFLNVTPATLTNKIKRMEKAGLVIRKRDPEDERVSRIYMTEKGRGIMNQLKESMREIETILLNGFSEAEIEDLREKISRILENISEFECGTGLLHHHGLQDHGD